MNRKVFTFVQVTDTHIASEEKVFGRESNEMCGNLEKAVEEINSLKPAFVILTGDLVNSGDEMEYESFKRIVARFKSTVYSIPGNHEFHSGTLEHYKFHLGEPYYSFDYDSLHFVGLDTSCDEIWTSENDPVGKIDSRQIEWLKLDLEQKGMNQPTVIFTHHPLHPKWVKVRPEIMVEEESRENVLSLLKRYNIVLVLSGHHHGEDVSTLHEVTHIVTQALSVPVGDKTPVGYRICQVYQKEIVSLYKVLEEETTIHRVSISLD